MNVIEPTTTERAVRTVFNMAVFNTDGGREAIRADYIFRVEELDEDNSDVWFKSGNGRTYITAKHSFDEIQDITKAAMVPKL